MGREQNVGLPVMLLIIGVLLALPCLLGVIFLSGAFFFSDMGQPANDWKSENSPVEIAPLQTRGADE